MRRLIVISIFTLTICSQSQAAIVCSSLTSGSSTTDATSYETASITPTSNALVLLAFTSRTATADIVVGTASGNSLTWDLVDNIPVSGNNRTVVVRRAMGVSPTTGTITISFGAQTQTSAIWSVVECTGVDTSGSNGSGAIVQSIDQDSGAMATSFTNTMADFGSTANAGYTAAMHIANEATTPGSSWSEIHDVAIAENAYGFQTQYKINDKVGTASWATSSFFQDIAIEIKDGAVSRTFDFLQVFDI